MISGSLSGRLARWWRMLTDPLDIWLLMPMFLIYIMSLFLLYSADGQSMAQLQNKTVFTLVGLILVWLLARFKPQSLSQFAPPLYVMGVLMLIAVHFVGVTVNGSTRWLNIGITRIQPSEIMKIALPMTIAWYFQRNEMQLRARHYLIALALVLVPGLIILKQPDLGTATLIMASGIFVIFFAGLPWKVIAAALAAAPPFLYVMWHFVMRDYQKQRVLTLLDPSQDPLGAGYHIIQAMIAIGSGGIWGKGWLNGTQAHLDYIPESTTDFIFAVFGEEFGLIGNILLVLCYFMMIARGLQIAARARTLYGRLLAGALTMTLFCYAFVNMGMVSGILPVVGVPLPLVSYGGTATISIMVIIGILMGVANQSRRF